MSKKNTKVVATRRQKRAANRLRKHALFILSLPSDEKVQMRSFASRKGKDGEYNEGYGDFDVNKIGTTKTLCDTAGCIAGWLTVSMPESVKLKDGAVIHLKDSSLGGEEAFAKAMDISSDASYDICQDFNIETRVDAARKLIEWADIYDRGEEPTYSEEIY